MFQLCESMKWSHLPVAGGIYDQDPDLLDGFLMIFSERSRHDQEEAEREKRNANRGKNPRGASRRRR